jgi:hypothetical protein
MRISSPELVVDSDTVTLKAEIALAHAAANFPPALWFRFPRRFEPLLSRGAEPFVAAVSSLASALDEPIEVDAAISERLSVGLEEYWAIISCWAPQRFHPVRLNCHLRAGDPAATGAAAAAFSGGVDSFFTLFRGADRPSTYRIGHALFIHGFDIPLAEQRTYAVAAAACEDALAKMGVALIRAETNARDFIPAAHWEMGHGSLLAGAALTLAGGVRRFFVPSSKSYTTLAPWGSDPLLDGLLSTDQLQIVHDGARYTRFDKLQAMKDWVLLRPLLRTCYERVDGLRNCGRCSNCRRTMFVLDCLGVLEEFTTFPSIRSPSHFLRSRWETQHERLFGTQAIAYAAANGRPDLAWVGRIAMQTSRVTALLGKLKVWSRPYRRRLQPNWGRRLKAARTVSGA